jgi:hypothetical protein
MYVPFSNRGANAYITSLGEISTMEIHGTRLGFLICYEQVLTWPFFSLMWQKPDVVIAPGNLWWCKNTSLPGILKASNALRSRLFNVPLLLSINI